MEHCIELKTQFSDLKTEYESILEESAKLAARGEDLEEQASELSADADRYFEESGELEEEAKTILNQIKQLEEEYDQARSDPDYVDPKWLEQEESLFDFV